MKTMKKMMAVLVALAMTLAMGTTAFAQTVALNPADDDGATITINNPARGETYKIYKLFDATVAVAGEGEEAKIAYQSTGNIPASLTDFFEKDASNNVTLKAGVSEEMSPELKAALEAWTAEEGVTPINTATSDGSKLEFTGLPYGYYVVTTTNTTGTGDDAKSAITVTSTQPNASIYDKNVNTVTVKKEVDKTSYSIGDTITYTATFDTTNYVGEGANSRQVQQYEIKDTLPEFLSNVQVTSITIGGTPYTVNDAVPQFDNKTIIIPWATKATDSDEYTSIYAQGAQIVMTYTAVLTSTTNIGKVDINTVSIQPYTVNPDNPDEPQPWETPLKDTAEIITYAAAIKKVDQNNAPLAGATFTIKGLTVAAVEGETGVYKVVSYNPAADAPESAELSTDSTGKLYIVGLAENVKLTVTEFKAPDGYNKLTETKEHTPQIMSKEIFETSGKKYYDADGNLVKVESTTTTEKEVVKNLNELDTAALEIVNNQGSLLPSTGGIGTTIFYIVGAALVIGAAVLLVTKKRMSKEA